MKRQHPTDPNLLWCSKCQAYKPATTDHWYERADSKTGFRGTCKKCTDRKSKKYHIEHAGKIKQYMNEYAKSNPDKINRSKIKWAECNPVKRKESANRWAKSNRGKQRLIQMRGRNDLQDWYVRYTIKKVSGIGDPPTEIIELKRKAITIKRIERSMVNELAG